MQHKQRIYVMMFNSLQAHKLEISSVDGVHAVVEDFYDFLWKGRNIFFLNWTSHEQVQFKFKKKKFQPK